MCRKALQEQLTLEEAQAKSSEPPDAGCLLSDISKLSEEEHRALLLRSMADFKQKYNKDI